MELIAPDDHLLYYYEENFFDGVRAKMTTKNESEDADSASAIVGAENIIECSKLTKLLLVS